MSIGNGKLTPVEDNPDVMSLVGVCRHCHSAIVIELDMTMFTPEEGALMVSRLLKQHTKVCGGTFQLAKPDGLNEDEVEVLSEQCSEELHSKCDDEDCECNCHNEETEV